MISGLDTGMGGFIGSAIVRFFYHVFYSSHGVLHYWDDTRLCPGVFDFGMNFKVYKKPMICYQFACNVCSLMRITWDNCSTRAVVGEWEGSWGSQDLNNVWVSIIPNFFSSLAASWLLVNLSSLAISRVWTNNVLSQLRTWFV